MKTRVLSKTLAMLLSGMILATGSYVPVMAENAAATSEQVEETQNTKRRDSQEQETILIASFDNTFEEKKYPLDQAPAEENLIQAFPSELSVTTTDGDSMTVPVLSWESSDYNPNIPGDYTFTPALAEGYDDSLAPSIPWIEVWIVKNKVTDIQTVLEDRSYLLSEAPAKDEIESALPKTLTASVNGEDEDISILSWDTDYDMSRVGTYTFLPVIDDTRYSYESTELPLVSVSLRTSAKTSLLLSSSQEGSVSSIGSLSVTVSSGAAKRENGDYVWTALNDAKGHQFVFRISYSLSGEGAIPGNLDGEDSAIRLTIPKSILKDKGGERSDIYEMSIPQREELSSMSEKELSNTIGLAYYEEGDSLVVYNFKPMDAAQNEYIEVAYEAKDRTFCYPDYGSENSGSSPFQAVLKVSGLTQHTTPMQVFIDTSAGIESTYKYYPKQALSWKSSWGQKPSDADHYVWQRWEIRSDIADDPTQGYDFILKDEVTCDEVPVEVYGYQFSGSRQITQNNRVSNITGRDGYRYDYVYTRIKRSDWKSVTSYKIRNKITATVHPVCGVDKDESAVSTREFSWTLPIFSSPGGYFFIWKYGNENWTSLFGQKDIDEWNYASYDLDQFQEGKASSIDELKYAIWMYGYPFQWTLKEGGSPDNPYDYGAREITYQLTDEAFYNLNADGTYGEENQKFQPDYINGLEEETPGADGSPLTPRMDPEDYDITCVSLYASYQDVPRDENGNLSEEAGSVDEDMNFNVQYTEPADTDVLTFWTKSGNNDYVKAGELNLGTGKANVFTDSLIDSIQKDTYRLQYSGDYVVHFKEGVDGFRVTTSNRHYYTDIKMYPYISVKNTDRMLAWTGTGKSTAAGATAKDAVLIRNVANLQAFDSNGKTLTDLSKTSGDRLRRSEKASEISKKVVGSGNNKKKRLCTVSWKVSANETCKAGSGEGDDASFLPQTSGTFYDLLPAGASLDRKSLYVAVPDGEQSPSEYKQGGKEKILEGNSYTVETVENYKDSGRTMLIVRIKDSGTCYSVYYETIHSWDTIADYGTFVRNPVAYETGNDEITGGFPDNPTARNSDNLLMDELKSDARLSAENRQIYTDLDPDSNEYRFIYDEAKHNIAAITAASAGLNKKVQTGESSDWETDGMVHPDETYAYRLRFANTFTTAAKDLILYDSLENYYLTDGAKEEKSSWYGTLTHIDTTQMEKLHSYDTEEGAAKEETLQPVIYVSIREDLDLDEEEHKDLSNTAIWTKMTDSTDLSKVKAVAYDLRKDTKGNDFVLKPGGSISAVLYLRAPHSVTDAPKNQYPGTYNNVYLSDSVIGTDGSTTPYMIRYDYSTMRYAVTASFGIHKVSSKDPAQSIKGISFRLLGTSDYGTEVNQIIATDKNGKVQFENVEKGSYVLQEYSGTPDWLEDHTEHTVIIDENASVWIDGRDYTEKEITITNDPRIHADIELLKREAGREQMPVRGASFKLSGTSDYGNDVLLYAESENGKLLFADVEKGKYTLQEIKAPDEYLLSNTKYSVVVDESGAVSIDGLTKNTQGLYTVLNEKIHSFHVIKRSSYDNSPIEGAEFHLTGTSDYGTKVDQTAISKANGFADFTNLEAGTYLLQEIKTDQNHKLDETKHVVRISYDNKIQIDGLEKSAADSASFIWINTRIPNEEVTVIKKWVGNVPEMKPENMPIFHLEADKEKEESSGE